MIENNNEIKDIFIESTTIKHNEYACGLDNIKINSLTISQQITKLSDVFVEWYLFDSSTSKSIDSFLINENITDIISNDDFIALMSGYNNLSDDMVPLIQEILPYNISIEKLHKLNTRAYKNKSNIKTISPDALLINNKRKEFAKNKIIERKTAKQLYMKTYSKQYQQEHSDELAVYRHNHYEKNKDIIKKKQQKYRLENKKKLLQQKKDYYKIHKKEILEYQKRYYQEHKESIIARVKKYANNNKDIINDRNKSYYQRNKERIKKQTSTYYANNKEEINAKNRKTYAENKKKTLLSNIILSLYLSKEK